MAQEINKMSTGIMGISKGHPIKWPNLDPVPDVFDSTSSQPFYEISQHQVESPSLLMLALQGATSYALF